MMQHFHEISRCLEWLAENQAEQPTLDDVAAQLQLSPAHAQRLFKRAVGLSPKQYLQALTLERSRALLKRNETLLDTALQAGLSGPSRLHDLFVNAEAMTPGEYRRGGQGLVIDWAAHESPFGELIVCETDRGVAAVEFVTHSQQHTLEGIALRWPRAQFRPRASAGQIVVDALFGNSKPGRLNVLLSGTPFQVQVWQALIRLPMGARVSYAQLATAMGKPKSYRAVANAVGANSLAVLIPCHRVIRASGAFGGYRWGTARKLTLLALEDARTDDSRSASL